MTLKMEGDAWGGLWWILGESSHAVSHIECHTTNISFCLGRCWVESASRRR
jgi:hypothetical protein